MCLYTVITWKMLVHESLYSLTTCLRFFSVGVSSSTINSIPASLRNTSLRSSSKFGVGGLRKPNQRHKKTFSSSQSIKTRISNRRSNFSQLCVSFNLQLRPQLLEDGGLSHQWPQRAVFLHGVLKRSGRTGRRVQIRLVIRCDKSMGGENRFNSDM